MLDTENAYNGTLEEAREMLAAKIAQTFVERNTPIAIRWFSDPAFSDWLAAAPVTTTLPPSMEEIPELLADYLTEAHTCAADIYGNMPPEEFYRDCARNLLETARHYFSLLAVRLFSRIKVDVSECDAAALLEAYRQARAGGRTAEVGKMLVFYRLCEMGGLNGQTYAEKYIDFIQRTQESR